MVGNRTVVGVGGSVGPSGDGFWGAAWKTTHPAKSTATVPVPTPKIFHGAEKVPDAALSAAGDAAVAEGLDYHDRNPGTLILVIADHETGGIHLPADDDRNSVLEYGTDGHTAVRVPIFAIGPGAERFGGLIDNDEVGRALLDLVRGARAVRPNPGERP